MRQCLERPSQPPAHRARRCKDAAAVPVVAVVLMVLLTFAVAAGTLLWLKGFEIGESPKTDPGVLAATGDADRDGKRDYIRLHMVIASQAPYYDDGVRDDIHIAVLNGAGSYDDEGGAVCSLVPRPVLPGPLAGGCPDGAVFGTDTIKWEVGKLLFMPCLEAGDHQVLVAVQGQVVVNHQVHCDEATGA